MNSGQIVEWSSWEDGGIAVDFNGNRFVNVSRDCVTGVVIREIIQHCNGAGEDSFWPL